MEFYLQDQTIDIYDPKARRLFLKRTKYPQLTESELHVGATVTIYSRQFKVIAYGDDFTRKSFHSVDANGPNLQRSFMLIKPDAYLNIGKIITMLESEDYKISNIKMSKLQANETQELMQQQFQSNMFVQEQIQYLMSDVVVGIEVIKNQAIEDLKILVGPENPIMAKQLAP